MNKIIRFIKIQLSISVILSIIFASVHYYLSDNPEIANTILFGLSFMGASSFLIILSGLLFPEYIVPGYTNENNHQSEVNENVTVYFYDSYNSCGLCKVTKFYGDPKDINEMQSTFSFIDLNGEYITDNWFYNVGEFKNNRCIVCLGDYKYNIINNKGEFICHCDYKGMGDKIINGYVKVGDGEGGINFVNASTGKELWTKFKKELCA